MLAVMGAAPRNHLLPGLWEEQAWAYDGVNTPATLGTTTSGVVVDAQGGIGAQSFLYYGGAGVLNAYQSWTSPADPTALTGVLAELSVVGSPSGEITLSIRAHSGTYGTSSVPTGGDLVASTAYDVASIVGRDDYFFTLSGWTPSASTPYVVFIDTSGVIGDASNYVQILATTGDPTDGNMGVNTSSVQATYDLNINVYAAVAGGAGRDEIRKRLHRIAPRGPR